MMNQRRDTLEPILRRLELTDCPECQTPVTDANIGWNPAADDEDVFPSVYIACKVCQKRLRVFHIRTFAQSLDDAIEALQNADTSGTGG